MKERVDFRFVQKEPSNDGSFDICHTYVFFVTFTDVRNKKLCRLKYVGRAEKMGEVIAVKFYASRDRKSRYDKYSLAHKQMGVAAVMEILHRCLEIIMQMMKEYPRCSFIVKASEAFDPASQKIEPECNNQRFRIYRSYLTKRIGNKTFEHFQFQDKSVYVLVRREVNCSPEATLKRIMSALEERYKLNWFEE